MPFASQAQQRMAFARGMPWAKRWAAETDFSKLPKRVQRIRSRKVKGCTCKALAEGTAVGPPGPQIRPAVAAPAAGGKGEQLAPGVTRIRGNLCNVHGKYGPCDKGLSGKKPKGGKGKKPPKPKQTPEQRAQARAQQQQANAADVAKRMAESDTGLSPSGSKTLLAMRTGAQPDATQGDGLVKMGLAERAADGSYRMTPTGRAVVGAMEAGDYQRAVDTISRGTDTATARAGRQSAAAQRRQDVAGKRAAAQMDRQLRQQERDAKRQATAAAKKPSGGGGGKKPEAAPAKRQARQARRSGGGAPSIGGVSSNSPEKKPAAPKPEKTEPQIAPALQQAAQALSEGADVSDQQIQQLITNGLVKLNKDGEPILTAAGQRVTKKEAREVLLLSEQQRAGDHNAEYQRDRNTPAQIPEHRIVTIAASQKDCNVIEPMHTSSIPPLSLIIHKREHMAINKTEGGQSYPSSAYLVVEDSQQPSTWHLRVRDASGKPDHRLLGASWAALHGGYRGNKYAGPNAAEALTKLRALYASEKMPLPSEKSYESFTVYKDASGADRWLSVSSTAYRDRDREIVSTKALNGAVALADASGYRGPLRFWHVPGVELGDCDYQATAQDGRFLIESGTFRSPALAAAVKSHADQYQMSIGFTHPPSEPDVHGVFSTIAIFERSLVPRGRASNPLTQFALVTKETRMLTAEKQAELTKLLDGNAELLSGLLNQVAATDKAAQDQGVAYKDAPDIRAIIREELASLLGQTTEKAGPMMGGGMMADEETPAEDTAEGGMEEPGEENMLTSAEIAAIAQQTAQVLLDSLMPHLGIGQKMDEVKSMLGGMAGSYARKDAETAEIKAELEKVKAQVDDLSGAQPRIMAGGFRASQAATTITTDDTKLKDAQPSADPVAQSFGAFMTDLFGNVPGQVAPGA